MVKYSPGDVDALFQAMADATRRSILERVAEADLKVTEIAAPYQMSLAAVSKHLRVLERARLIVRYQDEQDRRIFWCSLNRNSLEHMTHLIEGYRKIWEQKFDSLERYLEKRQNQKNNDKN